MNLDDPCRAAILLVQEHGADAKSNAIRHIVAMKLAGDIPAEVAWTRIFGAIVALEATECARRHVAELSKGRAIRKPRQVAASHSVQRQVRRRPGR